MKNLQKMGKALMLPISCMPICGILMGLGYLFCPAGMQGGELTGALAKIGFFLIKAGSAVIDHLPILFAICLGFGLTDGDGVGGLAALVSWLMITVLLKDNNLAGVFPKLAESTEGMLAFEKIENPFIGILCGVIGAFSYEKFKNTRLPSWISFFSGKRSVVIVSGLISIAVAAVLLLVWPVLFTGLVYAGKSIAKMGALGSAIYAVLNRLLIPFGLHHALNNVFWFDTIGLGDLTAFWAGKTSADVGWSLGMYMSGFFPCMMCGIPAALLAMYHTSKKENRKKTLGAMIPFALCSFLCGVTEPFEFSFMFVSPLLYVVYALLFGVFTYITNMTGFRAGFSFSGGLIDLLFSSSLPAAEKTLLIIPLGAAAFAVFYLVFRFFIVKFDLKTAGREDADNTEISGNKMKAGEGALKGLPGEKSPDYLRAAAIIRALGGASNITSLGNCATRLRIELADGTLCDDKAVKAAGAAGIMHLGERSVQVVIGMDVEFVAEEMKRQMESADSVTETPGGIQKKLEGKTGNPGIAMGSLFVRKKRPEIEKRKIEDVSSEIGKLEQAIAEVRKDLESLKNRIGGKAAEIIDARIMMLTDESVYAGMEAHIEKERICAEYAAVCTGNEKAAVFEAMDNEYLRARSADIKDVCRMVAERVSGFTGAEFPELPSIVAAEEFTPEEISGMDRSKVLALVAKTGSAVSHTAILAGNYGIPYLYGIDIDGEDILHASYAAVDAGAGTLILDPDDDVKNRLQEKLKEEEDDPLLTDYTEDKIRLFANIGGPEDLVAVKENGAGGIGLFRTEFLYMNRNTLPSEDEQFEVYKKVLEEMGGKEVVIRTMDIGADKKTGCLELPEEENPALGRRAIRICLDDTGLFRTQLRALLRAACYGNELIMYPMIASLNEIDEIHEQVEIAAEELKERGVEYRIPPQGIMIETPAAAMLSDEMAKKVDFFSIGTNDLTQYTLALDRQAKGLERFYNPAHEAVLRLIELTVKNAHRNNIWTGICGELGGNPDVIPRLAEMGVDELSMSPVKIRTARRIISRLNINPLEASRSEAAAVQSPADALPEAEEFGAPADGVLIPMEEIPDETFAAGILGKCAGVEPSDGRIYAPCSGIITTVADTKHAIGIRSDKGNEILIHIGIDTVELNGKGFDCKVKPGDHVNKDDLIMNADIDEIRKSGYSAMIITVLIEQ